MKNEHLHNLSNVELYQLAQFIRADIALDAGLRRGDSDPEIRSSMWTAETHERYLLHYGQQPDRVRLIGRVGHLMTERPRHVGDGDEVRCGDLLRRTRRLCGCSSPHGCGDIIERLDSE